jgi:hypothetical protein
MSSCAAISRRPSIDARQMLMNIPFKLPPSTDCRHLQLIGPQEEYQEYRRIRETLIYR